MLKKVICSTSFNSTNNFFICKSQNFYTHTKKATQCGLSVEKLNDVLITNIDYAIIGLI